MASLSMQVVDCKTTYWEFRMHDVSKNSGPFGLTGSKQSCPVCICIHAHIDRYGWTVGFMSSYKTKATGQAQSQGPSNARILIIFARACSSGQYQVHFETDVSQKQTLSPNEFRDVTWSSFLRISKASISLDYVTLSTVLASQHMYNTYDCCTELHWLVLDSMIDLNIPKKVPILP